MYWPAQNFNGPDRRSTGLGPVLKSNPAWYVNTFSVKFIVEIDEIGMNKYCTMSCFSPVFEHIHLQPVPSHHCETDLNDRSRMNKILYSFFFNQFICQKHKEIYNIQ